MADIELIIKIPEELYYLVQNKLDFNGDLDKQRIKTLMLAIDNSIPLPKGHERLIDANALICEDETCIELTKNALTIIEADNERG